VPQYLDHALFQPPPLKFRTVGFPQYGYKRRSRVLSQLQPYRFRFAVAFVHVLPVSLSTSSVFSLAAIGLGDGVPRTTYVQRRFALVRLCCPHRLRYYRLIRQSSRYSLIPFIIQGALHRPDLPHFDRSSLPACRPLDAGGPIECLLLVLPQPFQSSARFDGLDILINHSQYLHRRNICVSGGFSLGRSISVRTRYDPQAC
jgi:hypothetical protein